MSGGSGKAIKLPAGDSFKIPESALCIGHELIERRPGFFCSAPTAVNILTAYLPAPRLAHGAERLQLRFGILMGVSLGNAGIKSNLQTE